MYPDVFVLGTGYGSTGLRYFNVFGTHQDHVGAYAAVIRRWINAMLAGEQLAINGDGSNSRDFCYVDNVGQADLRAALLGSNAAKEYKIGVGDISTMCHLLLICLKILAILALSLSVILAMRHSWLREKFCAGSAIEGQALDARKLRLIKR